MALRDDLLLRAKLCEQAERYADMAEAMKAVSEMGIDLSNEERNLLSIAYKHVSGARRSSWRVISSMEQMFEEEEPWKFEKIQVYREKLQEELAVICTQVLQLIDKNLLRVASTNEAKAFYLKMKGDYYRYEAEVIGDPERRRKLVNNAEKAYREATEIAQGTMKPANPIRLGLALNYSVFMYEVKSSSKRACSHAKEAFDAALEELDTFREESYKDSTIIMQLLRDNINSWSTSDGHPTDVLATPKD